LCRRPAHLIEPYADDARRITVGGDKDFDTQNFVFEMREISVPAHVAQNRRGRRSPINGRTTRSGSGPSGRGR
jgi:hypothetical protein